MNKSINKQTLKPSTMIMRTAVWAAVVITAAVILFLVGFILVKGIPNLVNENLFAWDTSAKSITLLFPLINTVIITVLTLLIAAPLSIFAAIWLAEYAKRGLKLVKIVRLAAETLAGIPSIVYGLFGMLFFVTALKWSYSILAGAFTLAIMVLPLIMRTTEESLLAIPDSYREGSFGLGAGRLRTVFAVVLPSAIPGILAGIILAIGRIVGETAALLLTSGTNNKLPTSLMDSASTLSVHMYGLSREGLYVNESYATAVVLLVLVVGINALSAYIAKKLMKRQMG